MVQNKIQSNVNSSRFIVISKDIYAYIQVYNTVIFNKQSTYKGNKILTGPIIVACQWNTKNRNMLVREPMSGTSSVLHKGHIKICITKNCIQIWLFICLHLLWSYLYTSGSNVQILKKPNRQVQNHSRAHWGLQHKIWWSKFGYNYVFIFQSSPWGSKWVKESFTYDSGFNKEAVPLKEAVLLFVRSAQTILLSVTEPHTKYLWAPKITSGGSHWKHN